MRSEAESHPSIGPEIANPGADLANFLNFFGSMRLAAIVAMYQY